MDEHTTGWDATKIGAALAALFGAVRYLFRARSANAQDRIRKMERQMEDFKRLIDDLPADIDSISQRMRHQEVGLSDLRREMRDSLSEIEQTVKRTMRKLE